MNKDVLLKPVMISLERGDLGTAEHCGEMDEVGSGFSDLATTKLRGQGAGGRKQAENEMTHGIIGQTVRRFSTEGIILEADGWEPGCHL